MTPEFSRYRALLSATASAALRGLQPRAGSVLLGAPAARLLLADDAADHEALLESMRALTGQSMLRDPAGHQRPVYHLLAAHLCLRAFALRYESVSMRLWGACEDASTALIGPMHAAESYTGAPPPPAQTHLVLWQVLCVLEQAKLSARDVEAEWAEAAVGGIVDRPGPDGSLSPRGQGESLDAWTYHELCGLHALANLAVMQRNRAWASRVKEIVMHHVQRTQPDHVTTQPWALFAFAWTPDGRTFAEQQMHDAGAGGPSRHTSGHTSGGTSGGSGGGQTDAVAAMLLADAADAMGRF